MKTNNDKGQSRSGKPIKLIILAMAIWFSIGFWLGQSDNNRGHIELQDVHLSLEQRHLNLQKQYFELEKKYLKLIK